MKYCLKLCKWICAFCIACIPVIAHAQPIDIPPGIAKSIFTDFSVSMAGVNASAIGLPTEDELRDATLQKSRRVYILSVDTLRNLHFDSINMAILQPTSDVFFEVRSADRRILAVVEVEYFQPDMRILGLGTKTLAKALASYGDNAVPYMGNEIVIKIPAFSLYVLARVDRRRTVKYISLQNIQSAGIQKGTILTGKELYDKLKPMADRDTGGPG